MTGDGGAVPTGVRQKFSVKKKQSFELGILNSRTLVQRIGQLLLDNLVIGTDGDGGKVDVPDGVVGVRDGRDGRAVLPLDPDGLHALVAKGGAQQPKGQPQDPVQGVIKKKN